MKQQAAPSSRTTSPTSYYLVPQVLTFGPEGVDANAHRSAAMFTGQSAKHWVPPVQLAVVHASPASHCWLPHAGHRMGWEGCVGGGWEEGREGRGKDMVDMLRLAP